MDIGHGYPAHRAVFIISHDTPPLPLFQEKNPAYMTLMAAFINYAFGILPRTVIIYFFIIIDPILRTT